MTTTVEDATLGGVPIKLLIINEDELKRKIGLWIGAKNEEDEYVNSEHDIIDFLVDECGIDIIENVVDERGCNETKEEYEARKKKKTDMEK